MNEPAWKKLVAELRDAGCRSPYLDRLRERLKVDQTQDDLKRELLREMASSLGRAEDKVVFALLQLELIARELEKAAESPERGDGWAREVNVRVEAFNAQRRRAMRFVWELTIQREALGFRRNESLRELYPIPPDRAAVSG